MLKFLFGKSEKAKEKQLNKEREDFWTVWNHPTINKHFALIEKIKNEYSKARDAGDYSSSEMKHVISLCKQDIKIASECRDLWRKYDLSLAALPDYPSFSRLAIIYEKQKVYDKAINICQQAISLGFDQDGTKGGMKGKLDRLVAKKEKAKGELR